MKRKVKLSAVLGASLLLLSACGQGRISPQSASLWEKFVYFFAQGIQALSFGGQIWLGIVLFTLLIRTVLLPLFNMQQKSSQKMQDLQPQLRALQAQYPGKDTDSRLRLAEASQALYQEHGVNPYASLLPLLIQMPVLLALYQALTRVDFLKTGSFLWTEIAKPDPYFILPLLAAALTFLSSWLTTRSAIEKNSVMTAMTYMMPVMILLISFNLASGVVLYWTVSNAYQVFQILLLNNPFKIIAERQRLAQEEKEKTMKIRRAKKKAQKRKK
ncbi:YidC/Oxa1 family membrane protein insertase [Streptococcus cuniculipharyngis]|uniref:Membrane protein insertase YidC n=1 Tax=Streptococcus cuniculipharyngis TaxID=1562651 RepID=A0A5C5SAE2_9STRE|nr:YidC/Oxa1 family membrane protein insertase [Streptococcus cuniculipharyngis]TWS97658.1 membrane protein insertase YidC [Streptococcus cuniculipharyngis]